MCRGVGSSNDGLMHYVIGNIWSCVSQTLCCVFGRFASCFPITELCFDVTLCCVWMILC